MNSSVILMPFLSLLESRSLARPSEGEVLFRLLRLGKKLAADAIAHERIPRFPEEAIVPLEAATHVLLVRSRSAWHFSAQTYAQESAFAHEMARRNRPLAITTEPADIFDKSVMWFMPDHLVAPRLWDYSRQARQFAEGLERQGNRVFCSAKETAFWENKVHMHQAFDETGAPTPKTRVLTETTWQSVDFDIEPALIKMEHSSGSAGIYYFSTASEAHAFVSKYRFRPTENLIMQEVVPGATRDLRLTMVGDRLVDSCTYWRTKSPEALSAEKWTTTATTYGSMVDHSGIPASAAPFVAKFLKHMEVRTAGVDLIWPNDDLSNDPLILEFSPYYQPNPPKPVKFSHLSYKKFKTAKRFSSDGYLERQYVAFGEIARQILDQELF